MSYNFCRLCLQRFTGPPTLLDKNRNANNMVKHLFPGLDLSLVETSKICPGCFKYVQFSYTMRETVIINEQKIKSNMASIRTTEENTCRLCLNTNISESTVFLSEDINQAMPYLEARSIIEIAIVAMCFEIFKKPVVCHSCWQIVRSIYLFKKRCFATEKILKFYCMKNNVTSLTDNEIASISNCYNFILQKFSKGEEHDLSGNFTIKENMGNAVQDVTTSVDNIITPSDVYLNNFTTEDEDDVFKEEIDDIFVEVSKIDKIESSLSVIFDVKDEGERQNKMLDDISGNVEVEAAGEVKTKQVKGFSTSTNNFRNVRQHVIRNLEENGASERGINEVLRNSVETDKKKPTKRRTSTTATKKQKTDTDLKETVHFRIENIEEPSCLNEAKIIGYSGVQFKKTRNFKTKLKGLEKNKTGSSQGRSKKILECDKKGQPEILKGRKEATDLKFNIENNNDVPMKIPVKKPKYKSKKLEELTKKKLNDIDWFCDECEFKTKYKHHVSRHSLIHRRGEMLTCSKCVYSTYIKRNLDRHMLVHSSDNFLQCAHCSYATVNKSNLINHIMLQHQKWDNKRDINQKTVIKKCLALGILRCKQCPYVTSKKIQMLAHFRTHKSKEKVHKCTECHYITGRNQSLKYHMEIHDKDSLKKTFKCKLCSFTGKRYTHLVSHMIVHQEKYTFNCSQCSYKAKRKSHLVTHMLMHQSDDKKNCCVLTCVQCCRWPAKNCTDI